MRFDASRYLITRVFLGLLALPSGCWAAMILSNPDHSIPLNDVANRIMEGDGFQQKPLPASEKQLATSEGRAVCNPVEIRGVAIIRLRQYEDAVSASDTGSADQRLKSLRLSVDRALGCVPTEGFLWFIRYWSAINNGSPASDHFEELRMSYVLAPFEGWIALRRSPYALAIYDTLPPDLKEMAMNELVAIVASGFISDAVRILKGLGWPIRNELLPRLDKVRLDVRLQLDRGLRAQGLTVDIPGVEAKEFRPWR